jgi:hypothetical protein
MSHSVGSEPESCYRLESCAHTLTIVMIDDGDSLSMLILFANDEMEKSIL